MYMPSRKIAHFHQSCPSPLFLVVKTFSFMIGYPFSATSHLISHMGRIDMMENWENNIFHFFPTLHDLLQFIQKPVGMNVVVSENYKNQP